MGRFGFNGLGRGVLLGAFVAGGGAVCGAAGVARPNVVLFMVDDLGWQDMSVPFWVRATALNEVYETPNLERLANNGVLFTQAYASAISSPSRCSLLTGSCAVRHGVTNWTWHRGEKSDETDDALLSPDWNYNGVCQEAGVENTYVGRSFVDVLREAGYHTVHCGKAHWGAEGTPGARPEHFGFEVNVAGHAGGGPATYLSELNYGHDAKGAAVSGFAVPDLEDYWGSGVFLTEALTREALRVTDSVRVDGRPFFLNLSHYAVHVPIDRDMRFYEKYRSKGLSEKEAAYASLIEGVDKSLGDVLDWLERIGEAEHTVVLMVSDNGGYATGATWRDEPLYRQNWPLRCGKGSLLEGGVRVPMMVRWPGVTDGGGRCERMVCIEDFFPSILELAGVRRYRVPQKVDGRSFVPLLKGKSCGKSDRVLVWNYPHVWGNVGPGIDMNCAIRKGDWKLIYYYKTGKKELYNVREDISEQVDLSDERVDVVRRLSRELGRRLRAMGALRPSRRDTGEVCPWPDEVE